MSKKVLRFLAMICIAAIIFGMLSVSAFADNDTASDGETLVLAYTEIPLFMDGNYLGIGYMVDSITYVPMLAFCEAMLMSDIESDWDQETETAWLTSDEIDISMTLSDSYIVANGRYLYLADGAYNVNGTIIAPIRELAKIFGVDVSWDNDEWSILIDTESLEIIESGDDFYDEEALLWLSRVISAEAGAEPLSGMIGVGNVVLNRVSDDSGAFEDTIEDVIFQPGQFAVAETGAIYLEPNEEAVAAARLCLEGYNTVGDSKFFLNPELSSSRWFQRYKTYVTTISCHDFYA